MRGSWNFSTAVLEIWVLVLTKPGWANETPTASLKDGESVGHSHHFQSQSQHHHHHHHNHHYSLGGSISRDFFSNKNSYSHHLQHPHSSFYSSSSGHNNNRHYNGHNHHHHHLGSSQSASALASSLYSSQHQQQHRCYVCLPPNKNSREAQQILEIFEKDLRPLIPDCSEFDPYVDAGRFEFDCPSRYGGCILRIHGTNISRACSKYRVNDCKKANSVEFCYCTTPLCNDMKPEPAVIPDVVTMSRNSNSPQNSDGNGGNPTRRGNGKTTSSRTKSSLRGRAGGGEEEHLVGNSQGIRARVDDEILSENILVEDDDEDGAGSGTGSTDHHQSNGNGHGFSEPYTSTLDPTLFHEEGNGGNGGMEVEDPNPHTKIGISMTASTSTSSSSPSSIMVGGSGRGRGWSCTNTIHLVLLQLQRVLFVQVREQLSPRDSDTATTRSESIDVTHYFSQPSHHDGGGRTRLVVEGEKEHQPPGTECPLSLIPLFFNGQLCFILSLFLVAIRLFFS